MEINKYYRFDVVQYASMSDNERYIIGSPKVVESEYNVVKKTEKGVWVSYGDYHTDRGLRSNAHWISNTSKKKFAYPTRKEALIGFIARNKVRLSILKKQLDICQFALIKADKMLKEIK